MKQPQMYSSQSLSQKIQLLETVNKFLVVLGEEKFTLYFHQNEDEDEWFEVFDSSNKSVDDNTFDEVINCWEENF
jgi:hypothetical protein